VKWQAVLDQGHVVLEKGADHVVGVPGRNDVEGEGPVRRAAVDPVAGAQDNVVAVEGIEAVLEVEIPGVKDVLEHRFIAKGVGRSTSARTGSTSGRWSSPSGTSRLAPFTSMRFLRVFAERSRQERVLDLFFHLAFIVVAAERDPAGIPGLPVRPEAAVGQVSSRRRRGCSWSRPSRASSRWEYLAKTRTSTLSPALKP